jgi:hypothetical protein
MPVEERPSREQQRCGETLIVLGNEEPVLTKLQRIAEKASSDKRCQFTSLFHLMCYWSALRRCEEMRRQASILSPKKRMVVIWMSIWIAWLNSCIEWAVDHSYYRRLSEECDRGAVCVNSASTVLWGAWYNGYAINRKKSHSSCVQRGVQWKYYLAILFAWRECRSTRPQYQWQKSFHVLVGILFKSQGIEDSYTKIWDWKQKRSGSELSPRSFLIYNGFMAICYLGYCVR